MMNTAASMAAVDPFHFSPFPRNTPSTLKSITSQYQKNALNSTWAQTQSRKILGGHCSNKRAACVTNNSAPDQNPSSPPVDDEDAWELLRHAIVDYKGKPVGTLASTDPNQEDPVNYDQVFVRDFVPSAIAFLLKGESGIVRNFLLQILELQSMDKTVEFHSPGVGLMPASFKVEKTSESDEEVLDTDFGESAIGRVAPVDSGMWWIILLRAYGKLTGDDELRKDPQVQAGLKLYLQLCLKDGFYVFPALLVTDGSCMIDRRMGIFGHPLEIQALFYSALLCAKEILVVKDGDEASEILMQTIKDRLVALSFHIREDYWIDLKKINEIYRYKTEEYSREASNKFNIYPEQIPKWLIEWIPERGGYFLGNLQPCYMDFRFYMLGNLWAVVSSLGLPEQNEAVIELIGDKWDDLIAGMPLKICYPAMEAEEWRNITGSDPKNTTWSYHNGGSWPTLMWPFTLACMKMGRPDMARKAIETAEKRLRTDLWPEYYDGIKGNLVGKQAPLYQTWSIAGFLTSKMLLENPEMASKLCWYKDVELCNNFVPMVEKDSDS